MKIRSNNQNFEDSPQDQS